MIENLLFTIYLASIFIILCLIYLKKSFSAKEFIKLNLPAIKLLLYNKYHFLLIMIMVLLTICLIIFIPIGITASIQSWSSLITLAISCLIIGLGMAYILKTMKTL